MEWRVDFYQGPDGSAPVEEFLDSLRAEARAKALALVQALKAHGPNPILLAGRRENPGIADAVWQGQNQNSLLC